MYAPAPRCGAPGIYQRFKPDAGAYLRRMRLMLSIDGEEPLLFDSGVSPGGGYLQIGMDVALAANGFNCYDQVFALHSVRYRGE